MDEHEFKQILKEGQAALNKERQRLKNDPHKPRPWEEITPAQLKPAIEHIRKEFRTSEWELSMQVECGCYLALHPELATAPKFKGWQTSSRRKDGRDGKYSGRLFKESERFHYWSKQFSDGLAEKIVEPLNALLRIALLVTHSLY